MKKTGDAFLIAGVSFLLFILVFESRLQLPPWVQVFGRMHPLFLHFPIVLLLLYFFTFWIPAEGEWTKNLGLLAAITAVITAVMGMLLALEEPREGTAFFWHKWGGVSVALLAFFFYQFHRFFTRQKWVSRIVSLCAAFLLLTTGHWGAGLTHGENYLLAPMANTGKEAVPLDQATAFQHVILPIFEAKCLACHSKANSKGGLILDDTAAVQYGGKTGPLYEAGNPEKSLLVKRILLPPDDKKHMAPKTKPQLTEEEVQLLMAWIKAGAPMQQKIISLPTQDSFRLLAANFLSPAETEDVYVYDFPVASEKTIKALNNNYRLVAPLSAQSPALTVQFFGKSGYTPKALEELEKIKKQVVAINLARMPVKDEELKTLLNFENLQRLNLNYTDVTEKGLLQLTALKKLEELALSGTKVSPKAATELVKLPVLKSLFVWNTAIDSSAVVILKKAGKGIKIETGYKDDGLTILPLNPPVAKTVPGIYDPGTQVELKHPFRGVEIRYTLDEKEPDSVNSPVYSKPFSVNVFTVVKAKAYKQGWYGSKSLKAVYFIKGIRPDSVSLHSNDPGIIGKGNLLFDSDIGDLNLGSGAWIELKQPTVMEFFFTKPVTLQQVAMNSFVRMEWDIFPVQKIEVFGGEQKEALKKFTTWQQAAPAKMEEPDLKQPLVHFPATAVTYLKLVVHPLAAMPSWHGNKGKLSKVFVSEVVLQ